MTAARYWRVRFWDSTGADDIWLAEVEFIKPDSSIAAPVTAIASSIYDASYPAEAVFDGVKDSGNGWASVSKNCWIGADFATPVEISSVNLYMGWQSGAFNELPLLTAIGLDFSVDNTAWTQIPTTATGSNVPGGVITVVLNSPPRTFASRAGVAASAVVVEHRTRGDLRGQTARDIEFGGSGLIWGTTKTEISPGVNIPTKARVSILRERDKLLAREVWSDHVTGNWEVGGLDTRQSFIAMAQDADGAYRPVAADKTVPEAAP